MITDHALERNRRQAWASYYRARADAEQMAWWAAELGEYLRAAGPIPAQALELIGIVEAALPADVFDHIQRYVKVAV